MIKKTYQINTTRGVDLSSSPLNVAPSRASYMRNMISRNGINHKRNGWNEIASFEDTEGKELAINGIWEYVHPTTRDKSLIVYAGSQFFTCDYNFNNKKAITVESGATVNGEKCKAYYKDGLLWIIGCGDYLVYDGTSIVRVENSKYAYAPATSIDITTDRKAVSFEDVNLLTNKRVNKLVGAKSSNYYTLDGKIDFDEPIKVDIELYLGDSDYYDNYVPLTVRLDRAVIIASDILNATESPIEMMFSNIGSSYKYKNTEDITVIFVQPLYVETANFEAQASCAIPNMEFYNGAEVVYDTSGLALVDSPKSELDLTDKLENQKVTRMVIKAREGNYHMYLKKIQITAQRECTGLVNATYEGLIDNGRISISRATTPLGEGTLYNDKGEYKITADISKLNGRSEILFYDNVITPVMDTSNITVEYYADYERSVELTKSAVFTQTNGVDLLLVANKDNAIFYSGLDSADCEYSFGYMPAEKFITFGSDREPITAIVPMADSVGVFKGKSFYRVSFTFHSDSETYEADYIPQITEATDTNGCVNQFVSCNVNGDTLIFDGAGVYGIEYSSSLRSLKRRSSNIDNAFKKYTAEQLKNAVALEHEGRYYLFIDSDVYIADSRFKVYESNRLDTSFEYEWWIWDNCPASVAYSIDGKLYLGKTNGRIAVFDDKFSDRIMLNTNEGEIMCTQCEGYTQFTFNKMLEIKDGDKIILKNGKRLLANVSVSKVNDGIYKLDSAIRNGEGKIIGDVNGIYIGMRLYVGSKEYPGTVVDYDAFKCCFLVEAEGCSATEGKADIFADVDGIAYTVVERKCTDDETELVLTSEGKAIELYDAGNVEATILRETPVRCEYHTPVLDLGSNLSLKILNQLVITVSKESEGEVKIGYQTNNNNAFVKRQIGGAFDFNNFNFNAFAFDGTFYKTRIQRVFERNFNYILFRFASSSDSDFAIENFTCVYSSNNKLLKGDR